MFCHAHEKRLASAQCTLCGKALCPDCENIVRGEVLCDSCVVPDRSPSRKGRVLKRNPFLAALLSIIPGLGQVYNGEPFKALFIFITCWMIVPWFYGMYDAYASACRINEGRIDAEPRPTLLAGCLLVIILMAGIWLGAGMTAKQLIYDHFLIPRAKAEEQAAQEILLRIGKALQLYRSQYGQYPDDIKHLYFADPPYLKKLYCGQSYGAYGFVCNLSEGGYELRAIPDISQLNAFALNNDGELLVYEP
ncbi:MAG: hypothetical protein ACLFPX_02820 [Candidatus Omnitrophota bacterium]